MWKCNCGEINPDSSRFCQSCGAIAVPDSSMREARKKALEEQQKFEEKRIQEAERKRQAEEEQRKREEEKKRQAEEEQRRRDEEEHRRHEEEIRRQEEDKKQQEDKERRTATWKCSCGEENPVSSRFCQSCGTMSTVAQSWKEARRHELEEQQRFEEKRRQETERRRQEEEQKRRQEEEEKRRQEEFYAEQERQREEERQKHHIRIKNLKNMGHDGYYEYKTISLMDESGFFKRTGRVNIEQMSDVLNELGLDGWHLVTAYSNELGKNSTSIGGFGTNSTVDEHILIFERFIRFQD